MKASDLNFPLDTRFDLSTGIITFKENRLLIFDANSIGLLRQRLIKRLGYEEARALFLELGFQNGYTNFLQLKIGYEFDSEEELMLAGTIIHTAQGLVKVDVLDLHFDRVKNKFFMRGSWLNSYEAEQHLSFNHPADQPVCWSLMGYASGWSSAFFGSPVIAIESHCEGMGADHCEFIIQTIPEWGEQAKEYLAAYKQFFEFMEKMNKK